MTEPLAEPVQEKTQWYLLEREEAFSRSLLWELQRRYYSVRGIDAWSRGEVPHYITSNPTLANSYAEIAFALWQDHQRLYASESASLSTSPLISTSTSVSTAATDTGAWNPCPEPMVICELGGGTGRFAFHFLSRLLRLCADNGVAPEAFRYVLTDQAESNLRFWEQHPRFQPLFEQGILDVATFEIGETQELKLQRSGQTISASDLSMPLVVIANYVLDSVPQDLLYLRRSDPATLEECRLSLLIDTDPDGLDIVELIKRIKCRYDRVPIVPPYYPEPELESLLEEYRRTLKETNLLFPATSLRCLQRLKGLSKVGLLLLTADKGGHSLAELDERHPPRLVIHGSFSLNVNFHAIKAFCEAQGGVAMFPEFPYNGVNISACLMVPEASRWRATQLAYRRHVEDFSPDDFYTVINHAEQSLAQMSVAEVMAYLRLSHYDSFPFLHYLPRLMELAPQMDATERQTVRRVIDRVGELYFPLAEEPLLLNATAGLLYALQEYTPALVYCERLVDKYGPNTGTLSNMALCHHALGNRAEAIELAQSVLIETPDNEAMAELLKELTQENLIYERQ